MGARRGTPTLLATKPESGTRPLLTALVGGTQRSFLKRLVHSERYRDPTLPGKLPSSTPPLCVGAHTRQRGAVLGVDPGAHWADGRHPWDAGGRGTAVPRSAGVTFLPPRRGTGRRRQVQRSDQATERAPPAVDTLTASTVPRVCRRWSWRCGGAASRTAFPPVRS